MAGLNQLVSDVGTKTTSMPSWYDTAQQNIVSGAQQAYANAPAPGATVGQKAADILGAPTNAFSTAANTLQGIASGAASPWMTDASGNVVPNKSTALGGLFSAQDEQLKQLIPNITATPSASAIGSGQFGSLRGQTAANKAIADAAAQLRTQQMSAALQNQQTGVQAGLGAGTLTDEQLKQLLTVGQYQQAAPYMNVSNLGKVIGGIQAPTTVSEQVQYSPLSLIGGLGNMVGGVSGVNNLLSSMGIQGGLSSLGSIFNTNSTNSPFFNTGTGTAGDQPGDFPTQGFDINGNPINDLSGVLDTTSPNYDWSTINTGVSDLGNVASGVNLGGLFG